MKPIVIKILYEESVTHREWQDLFFLSYIVCLWDQYGTKKMKDALEKVMKEYTHKIKKVSIYYHIL